MSHSTAAPIVTPNKPHFQDRFKNAVDIDQTWQPQICMPDENGNLVDIVPLLNPSPLLACQFKDMGYPKMSSFRFGGFQGISDTNNIIQAIQTTAATYGSRLRGQKRTTKTSLLRLVNVDIICARTRTKQTQIHVFNDKCIQATNTIIQKEHQTGSRKGRTLSSTNDYVLDTGAIKKKEKQSTRRSTSICPVEKSDCCSFRFSIFCCSKDHKWYLSYSHR